jgi:alpha-tubulin suppressor-like RCC1 family protein
LSTWTSIFAANQFGVAVQSNGTLWTWGSNTWGQLGVNTSTTDISSPVQVGSLANWALPSGYSDNWMWSSSSNQLYGWGRNLGGQLGQNSTSVPSASSPLQVVASTYLTATKIASNYYAGYAIQSPGTLWAWGNNSIGQLGTNTTTRSNALGAVQVGAINYWTQISAGGLIGQAAGIQSPGTLWAWGLNISGQLGLSNVTDRSSPTQVGTLSLWTQVACGYNHTAAIQTPGTLWAWGTNSYGQLGNNSASLNVLSPIQIGTASNWSRVSCGYQFTIALQSNGTLWTWGNLSYGRLGYNTTSYRSSATQIGTVGVWTGFPTGSQNSFWGAAINSNNNLYVWGGNSNRILNSNYYIFDTTDTLASCAIIANPVPLDPTLSTPIKSASIGDQFGVYVQSNGTLWSWGNLSYGQVPIIPGRVPAPTFMSGWSSFSCGYAHTAATQSNGTLWTWGSNSFGQLGMNTTTLLSISSPAQIGTSSTWTRVSCGYKNTFAIKSNGTLWSWGENVFGNLGLNDTTNRSSPVQVGALSLWRLVSSSSVNAAAIQTNGTLWAWGFNASGAIGNNSTINQSSPVQVGALSIWTQIAVGDQYMLALQSNGTLWSWGSNIAGQLGLSNTTNRSSPVQVGTLSVWTRVSAASGGVGGFSSAIQSDGTLWSWGNNGNGQLGLSNTTTRSSPVQVGTLSVWTAVSNGAFFMTAIQSNGSLWAWGQGALGQLGLNTTTDFYSPVQVGLLSFWTQISNGNYTAAAVPSNSTLWTWGNNGNGQLGYLAVVAPVPISTNTTWSQVCCGPNHAVAVQSNGSLWTWGNNSYGQLGLGDLTHRSSTTQIGTTSNWSRVACGYAYTAAIQSNGSLWAWGSNSYGQLGQGNFTNTSTPVQVGTISRYVTVYAMNFTTLAETQ